MAKSAEDEIYPPYYMALGLTNYGGRIVSTEDTEIDQLTGLHSEWNYTLNFFHQTTLTKAIFGTILWYSCNKLELYCSLHIISNILMCR